MTEKQNFKEGTLKPENAKERKKIYFSHDGLFQAFFDEIEVAESFIKEYLPPEIVKDLDFSTLTLFKDSFVDSKFSRCYTDVLYHICLKNNPAYLYFLFEHKSWEPNFPGLQLLKNMANIWETHLDQHKGTKKLPPIIPLLIYHGAKEWAVNTNFISMFEIKGSLEKYIPAFNFELYDVSHMPDKAIKGELALRILLTTIKYIFSPELDLKVEDIFRMVQDLADKDKATEYLEMLLRYFSYNAENIKVDNFRERVTKVLEKGGAVMATLAQQWFAEGEEKTKLRFALACLKKGMDIDTITELTGLSVEKIELLKSTIQMESAANQ
jgi:predicted transposase/invertase (TIGR01784 family)